MRNIQASLPALLLLLTACGTNEVVPDASSVPDGASGGGADASADASTTCDPERTRVSTSEEPIAEGDHCDEIVVCAEDQAQAEAIEAVAPGFECGASGTGTCGEDIRCEHPGGTVSAADLEEVCAITVLPDPPEEVVCWIFL